VLASVLNGIILMQIIHYGYGRQKQQSAKGQQLKERLLNKNNDKSALVNDKKKN
jgi:hypothetical protein